MGATISNLFWDSCVFAAFLADEKDKYDIDSIEQYLDEAKNGKVTIYASTLAIAELLPSRIVVGGTLEEFLDDFQGAIIPIEPSVNIMAISSRLRDLPYRKGKEDRRRLSTPDAIVLASCLYLEEAYNVTIDCLHTFDGGGKKDLDGNRSIPILGYETWCDGFSPEQMALAQKIIRLKRLRPVHPSPKLFQVAAPATLRSPV